jgi:tetratricopeptide (TPR) repeat protein
MEVKSRPTLPAGSDSRRTILGICIFLAVITLAVFGRTLRYEFINFDDDVYVYNNPTVAAGVTLQGIVQAFLHGGSGTWDWVPLTTISHMLDCQFYGLNAGGHHLTNVLLHAASAILLFLVLRQMTGAVCRSAFVAAVFAIHPLRVESVAWVTERKDVLSGLFFMLTLWAYVRHVRRPGSFINYAMVALLFALGLMSKAMLVTLPFVLLLLDYWPLNRFSPLTPVEPTGWLKDLSIPARLMVEKIPLLLLSMTVCAFTVQALGPATPSPEKFPFLLRVGNALISYVTYVGQMFYPAGLAAFYPYPTHELPLWKIIAAFVLLTAVSLGVFIWRQKRHCLLVGWLWYLGMLVPVIGLVQAGAQAHADRFTYLPQIGLYLMAAWMLAELSTRWRYRQLVLGGFAAIVLGTLIFLAQRQTSCWKDSETFWTDTLGNTANNAFAHDNLGATLAQNGRLDEAIVQFQEALVIQPDYAVAHYNLGNALFQVGQADEAIVHYHRALATRPEYAEAHDNLGNVLFQKGQVDEAIIQFQKALVIRPDNAITRFNLGNALLRKGRMDEAIVHYQRALAIQPGFVEAQGSLARIAWVLATSPNPTVRNGSKAVELAQQTDRLSGGRNPAMAATLAAAYAEAGRFSEAITTAQRALELASNQNNAPMVAALDAQLKLYQAGSPFREAGTTR